MQPLISPQTNRKNSLLSCLAVGALLTVSNAHATLIVDWGGKYVGTYTGLTGTATSAAGSTTYAYSDTVAKSPAGPTFYGAFSLANGSGTGTPAFGSSLFGISPGAGAANDSIRFGSTAASGSLTMRGLLYFKKEDFLGVESGSSVTFDEASSLSINVTSSAPGGSGNSRQTKAAVYALVNGEWNWYVSLTAKAGTVQYQFADVGGESWAIYNIDASTSPLAGAPLSSVSYTTLGSSFEDIGAVGLFFNYMAGTEGTSITYYIDSIEVHANVVPEPSLGAMAAGATVLLLGIHRYGKRRGSLPAR